MSKWGVWEGLGGGMQNNHLLLPRFPGRQEDPSPSCQGSLCIVIWLAFSMSRVPVLKTLYPLPPPRLDAWEHLRTGQNSKEKGCVSFFSCQAIETRTPRN